MEGERSSFLCRSAFGTRTAERFSPGPLMWSSTLGVEIQCVAEALNEGDGAATGPAV